MYQFRSHAGLFFSRTVHKVRGNLTLYPSVLLLGLVGGGGGGVCYYDHIVNCDDFASESLRKADAVKQH